MKKEVEIVFIGPYNMHNKFAAHLIGEDLSRKKINFLFKPLFTLDKVANYVKNNSDSIAVISYYSNYEQIKSKGVDAVNKVNLFIDGVKRVHFGAGKTKDFFILSSGNGFIQKIPKKNENGWATFVVAERGRGADFSEIEKVLLENNISYSYSKWRVKGKHFYFEAECYADKLVCLSEIKNYKIKILGSYQLPAE